MFNCCKRSTKRCENILYKLTLTLIALVVIIITSLYSVSTVDIGIPEYPGKIVQILYQDADSTANNDGVHITEERRAREVIDVPLNLTIPSTAPIINQTSNPTQSFAPSQSYYEEQQAAVVHAENGPILGYPQRTSIPAQNSEFHYADYLSNEPAASDDSEYDDDPTAADDYLAQGGTDDDNDDPDGYYKRGPQYEYNADNVEQPRSQETIGGQPYDSYYRQWHYATPTPPAAVGGDRKLQQPVGMNQNRNPYTSYGDYDISASGPVVGAPAGTAPGSAYNMPTGNKPQQQQQQQYLMQQKYQMRRPSQQQFRPRIPPPLLQQRNPTATTSITASATPTRQQEQQSGENTLLSVVRQLKTMWDVYQAFTSAWNTLAERNQKIQQQHQKQQKEQQQKEQQQQQAQQTRINSKQPPKFVATQQQKRNRTKATKFTTTTKTETTILSSTTMSPTSKQSATKLPVAKVEPRKTSSKDDYDAGHKQDTDDAARKRRAVDDAGDGMDNEKSAVTDTAVAEGRYIKGDPLKGYYDFVITEGSYKFWAVFQVGTAILIIYSTFAAIYYSKVNPLVSDYDYTDYLGGARSLTGGDADFVDDDAAAADGNTVATAGKGRWLDWVPNTGHSLKFILDAIDKLPVEEHTDDVATNDSMGGKK